MFKQVDEEAIKKEEEAKKALIEAKKKAAEEPNPDDVELKAPESYDKDNFAKIDEARLNFLKKMKTFNIFKWIASFLAIGLLIFAWLYIMSVLKITWLGFTLTGVSLAIIIAYYFINKHFTQKYLSNYLKVFYAEMNAYVFSNNRFSNVKGDIEGKIDAVDFNSSNLYKEVSQIGSRNKVNFRVDNVADAIIYDMAAQQSTQKKLIPLFIGKYIVANNSYEGDEPIYIYLPGNTRSLPPNNIDVIPKVINTKKMHVHTCAKNYEKVFNAKVRTLVTKLITNNILIDASISITKGKTYIGLGYDDCLMVVPYKEKFNPIPLDRFNADMNIIADIINELANIKN